MSRRRKTKSKETKISEPNENVTMTTGNKFPVDSVFRDTGPDVFLNGLKRIQGDSVAAEAAALVSDCVGMTGISINRIDRMFSDGIVREEYGLNSETKSVYRTAERIGRKSDIIVKYLGHVLKEKYGIGTDTAFADWTSMYFEAPANSIIRFGYSRDHRSDRPQVTVGLSADKNSMMPAGLTMMPGNVLDVTHFKETFEQIRPILPDDATIVFDAGAYSGENAAIPDGGGFGFVTRLQLNGSDHDYAKEHENERIRLNDDISFIPIDGNLGRKQFIFSSEKRKEEILSGYIGKAERDYDEMEEIRSPISRNKRPRKKHRNGNCFVDTRLSYVFPLQGRSRREAVDEAVRRMTTGKEGLFMLVTNRQLTAQEVLDLYRSRNAVETAFRDLKHGIDWRPARCTSPDAVRGRILISFLALFCMSMMRFLHPEFRTKTAESIVGELTSFSHTAEVTSNGKKRRIWSNFSAIIVQPRGRKRPVPAPKVPEQPSLDAFG